MNNRYKPTELLPGSNQRYNRNEENRNTGKEIVKTILIRIYYLL